MGSKPPVDLLDSADTLAQSGERAPAQSPSQMPGATSTYVAGQHIGDKYRLLRPLGEGGMASVWVAHNEPLDIHVAIKFIRAELQAHGLAERLLQEARAAARLGHPAIVRVTDFGKTHQGDPYIVMELLTGEDLGAALSRRGALEPLRAVRTLLPIADALATAHAKKIVHRDLKPENIFLATTEEGRTQPKLVDFGIAKFEREDTQRITQMGAAMGSPAYMSPEQARGLDVDGRTDVWSMCVVLYETLTKSLPFQGPNYTALVCAILDNPPRPVAELGIHDAELWQIIARGLEKSADKRWQSMRELGTALARWAIAHGATDDVCGSNLSSTWIERPPDSLSAGPMVAASVSNPELQSAPTESALGYASGTQLSATVSGVTRRRSSPVLYIALGAAALLVVGVAVGVALRGSRADASGGIDSAIAPLGSEAPSRPSTETPTKVAPVIPSATGAESASPEPTAPKPAKKPVTGTKPATKTSAPTSTKTSPPTTTQKPPELDIKTNL